VVARKSLACLVAGVVLCALTQLSAVATASKLPGSGDGSQVQHNSVTIGADNEFNPSNGVVAGNGSRRHPFVISGWSVDTVFIHDTDAHYIIKNNNITGQLILNWTGDRAKVIDNTIADLRVNENVQRTGEDTDGTIVHNTFGVVGQLRHWNGLFAYNKVGSPSMMDNVPFSDQEAVNFDGFNGSHFRNNTIYGFVDATLHGHHFSERYGTAKMYRMGHEHQRYDQVWITHNKIYSSGSFALRYNDLNHAANDRTATSETDEALNEPHVHHTKVHMNFNKLYGAGLNVDVFNADDPNHIREAHGVVELRGNRISLARSPDGFNSYTGITVTQAQHLTLKIVGNTVTETMDMADSTLSQNAGDVGIWMDKLTNAHVYLMHNDIKTVGYGIRAQEFTDSVQWWVGGLHTSGVLYPVYWDNSVANHPHRRG
jgi:hypothetical protein